MRQDERNRQGIRSVGRWAKLPIGPYPTAGGICQHRRARTFRVHDITGLNRHPHVNIARKVQLQSLRWIRRTRAANKQTRTRSTISGSVGGPRRTAFAQSRNGRRCGFGVPADLTKGSGCGFGVDLGLGEFSGTGVAGGAAVGVGATVGIGVGSGVAVGIGVGAGVGVGVGVD